MTRLTGIRTIDGLPIGVFDTERYDGARGYVIHREDREKIIGRVYREARHVVRTPYKGKRYGYDRVHSCWSATPQSMDAPFQEGRTWRCYQTREQAIRSLVAKSARPVTEETPA